MNFPTLSVSDRSKRGIWTAISVQFTVGHSTNAQMLSGTGFLNDGCAGRPPNWP